MVFRKNGRAAGNADIVVLRGNPLEDLANARSIELVLNDGRVMEPSVLTR